MSYDLFYYAQLERERRPWQVCPVATDGKHVQNKKEAVYTNRKPGCVYCGVEMYAGLAVKKP